MSNAAEPLVATTALPVNAIPEKYIKRFWTYVDKSGPSVRLELGNCWIWKGGLCCGYGYFRWKERRAHRISWILHYGAIPDGIWVLHKCDNTKCIRPDHLFLGTIVENNADRDAKGRGAKGDRHWTRLYPEKVLRGENHPLHLHPEWRARGDKSGARLHPEKLKRGEAHYCARFTASDIVSIRKQFAAGRVTFGGIARQRGVTTRAIVKIVLRISWKHVA